MEKNLKLQTGLLSDDELRSVSGGASPRKEDDFSISLYCTHCGCKTKMQMISFRHAICEVCSKTNVIPTKL